MTSSEPAGDGERTRLNRDAVVERALVLADELGLEALTIRKLATALGVTPMALYWHFRSKEELLAGLADRVWNEIDVSVDPAAPWPEQIRGVFESLLAVLRTHPAAAGLLMRMEDKLHGDCSLHVTEVVLEVLDRAGFDPVDASAATRFALWQAISLVMSEPWREVRDLAERAEIQRRKQIELASLPPARYPHLIACAVPMTACDDLDLHYKFGVDMFIGGLTAIAAERARSVPGGRPSAPAS